MGEAHTKNKVASDLGKEILKHFNLRGLEGADEEKTVGGKFFLKAVDFLNAIAKLLSFGKNKLTEGSTIHDALVDRTPQETKAAMLRFLDTLNGHLNLDEMSDSELATLKIKIADKNKVEWFEGEAILNLLRTLRNDPEATSLPPTPRTINVELERGHKPDFGEHMTTVYVPTWISFCVASLCGSFLPETVEGVVRAGSLLMSTHVLLGNAATHAFPKIQTKSWAYLVNPLAGLGWARNHTMSQNIVRTIEKEESATMLVLVGKAHIPGMSHILRTRFGFENVNLPSESSLQGN